MRIRPGRRGFTLLEIIVAVAIVAIMAGVVTPMAYRQITAARRDATLTELTGLQRGLLDFYQDTGRFPSEAEGVAALVVDPGASGWQGPYVDGGAEQPATAVATDAFGLAYVYDLAPSISPAGSVDVLLISGGEDRLVNAGSLNHAWNLASAGDDVYVVVSAGPVQRDKTASAQAELAALAAACRRFYADRAAFPATPADLAGTYLDGGYLNDALIDGWNTPYRFTAIAGSAPSLRISSDGPDRHDDAGGGDDLQVTVSSIPPGRETTTNELAVAQVVLNGQPTLILAGAWAGGIRLQLGLADAFDLDGWGRSYQVNAASRVVLSAGPDGNAATVLDNVPVGVGP